MVRRQSTSRSLGLRVRADRSSAPATACTVFARSRSSSWSVTVRTTVRAVSRERSGMARPSPTSVLTRCTSGVTDCIISGSSSSCRRPSRSMASACITWTTLVGK